MANLLLFNKPFDVLCQFTDDAGRTTLAHHINDPAYKGYYPAGRLDRDSEGLVILTNDGKLQHRIAHPDHKLPKTYLIQVEGAISDSAIEQLNKGVVLKDGLTKPAVVSPIDEPPLWPRSPPIRERINKPTSWIKITITEGRNRQLRRMTAAVGFPTLRLIRTSIGPWNIENLSLGQHVHMQVNLPNNGGSTSSNSKTRNKPTNRAARNTQHPRTNRKPTNKKDRRKPR
ncbi:MAG: pseudouridine synthase [Alteromonadaceae bacterium]|nr:MAG: pseudouridine synthase [Alteromonadaceae bacterium]